MGTGQGPLVKPVPTYDYRRLRQAVLDLQAQEWTRQYQYKNLHTRLTRIEWVVWSAWCISIIVGGYVAIWR